MTAVTEARGSAAAVVDGVPGNPFYEAAQLVVRAQKKVLPAAEQGGIDEDDLAEAFDGLLEWLEKGSRLWLENGR